MRLPTRRIPAMSMTSPDRIEMNVSQQQRLRHLVRAGTTAQQLVARARIVLLAAAGWTNTKIAGRVGVCVDTVRKWRHRWWVQPGTASPGDAKRSGRPPSFTPVPVSYTHLRAHETRHDLVCRLLLEKK